jgi:alpha-beta hydrolase superfamily lysophospholipase
MLRMSLPMSGSGPTLTTFTAGDGHNLAVQDWPVDEGTRERGVVLLVHGLGEHAGRYDAVAQRLNAWGYAVRGYDQYGHGESGGPRGGLTAPARLVDDLADVVQSTRTKIAGRLPLVVLGHSMGGVVAATFAQAHPTQLDGLVLSSPALATHGTSMQRLLLRMLPRIAPNLRVGNGLDTRWLSHDPAVQAAYRADPLVHDRISARLAQFITEGGARILAAASSWTVPTLLLYAGDDRLVDASGSRAFAATAPRQVVSSRCFEGAFHEIFNEADAQPVFDALQHWLQARF